MQIIQTSMHVQPIYRINLFIVHDDNGRARSTTNILGDCVGIDMDIFNSGLCLPSDNRMIKE